MSAEILPFDFEEQAVRVVMRDDEPWFVAADVCRVLEIGNASDAVRRLDDDERMTLDTIEGQTGRGGARSLNIISESGLYALVLTSRKEQARRFRKWITAEVLPAIRKHGRYEHPGLPAGGDIAGLPLREAEIWLQLVREARLTRGRRAAVAIWARSPLPQPGGGEGPADAADGRACLDYLRETAWQEIAALRSGAPGAIGIERALSRMGLRWMGDGLFVAGPAHPGAEALFAGTAWAGGGWRRALLAAGAQVSGRVLRIDGIATRGVFVPEALLAREVADA